MKLFYFENQTLDYFRGCLNLLQERMVEKTLSCLCCCNECQVTPLIHKRIWLYLKGWGREVKKSEDFTSSVACEKSASGVGPEQEGHEDRTW